MIIRKSNPIPVQPDGAGASPPALGVETCSGSHPSAPAAFPLGSGRNLHDSPAHESLIASERRNPFLHDLVDETRSIFGRHLVVPFNIIPFHGGACGD